MTSLNPNVSMRVQVVPTLLIYYGDLHEIQQLNNQVTDRLLDYSQAGVVRMAFIESGDDVQLVSLPVFEEWFGPNNTDRYNAIGNIDRWQELRVNYTNQLRVLVCVTDSQMSEPDLQQLHQIVVNTYANKGITEVVISLLWLNDQPLALNQIPYYPQIYVNRNRVRDGLAVMEHGIVAWITSTLTIDLNARLNEVQNGFKNRTITTIWLGAASIYVDVAFVFRTFRERVSAIFMEGWLRPPVAIRVLEELRNTSINKVQEYRVSIDLKTRQVLRQHGWIFSDAIKPFMFSQSRWLDLTKSGFIDTSSLGMKIFGGSVNWWLDTASVSGTIKSLIYWMKKVTTTFAEKPVFSFPSEPDLKEEIATHLQEVQTTIDIKLMDANNQMYNDLQDYFLGQLFNPLKPMDKNYGLKRMLIALKEYIEALNAPYDLQIANVNNNKAMKLLPMFTTSHMFHNEVASLLAHNLHIRRSKIVRERMSLLSPWGMGIRMIVTYPLLLCLIFLFVPIQSLFLIAISLAVLIGLLGWLAVIWSVKDFYGVIDNERNEFFAEQFTPVIVKIVARSAEEYRIELHKRLTRLHEIYAEIDDTINNLATKPSTVVDNHNVPTRYVLRNLTRVFGTQKFQVDTKYKGEPWDSLRDESIQVYEANQQSYPSWVSRAKSKLNQAGKNRDQAGKNRAEVTILHDLAKKLFEQQRMARTAFEYMYQQIDNQLPSIKAEDPISLDELLELTPDLKSGQQWLWLESNSKVDGVPRSLPVGISVVKSSMLLLTSDTQTVLQGLHGANNPNYRMVDIVGTTVLKHEMVRVEFEFDIK